MILEHGNASAMIHLCTVAGGESVTGPKDWLERLGLRSGGQARLARISRAEVDSAKDRDWAIAKPVFDFLARAEYRDLTPRQRVAQLTLFYSNDIENGGHLQYFHNEGMERADELLAALAEIGAECQREILERALGIARANPVEQADSLEDYSDRAYEAEFRTEDDAFYACRPEIGNTLLPAYILEHLGDFAELE
jgi:hypothetical protein